MSRAWSKLSPQLPLSRRNDLQLVKVGDDFTEPQQELIKKLGVERCIACLGRVSSADLVRLYQAADLLVFPSWYEGFGWPPLEAMACGTPVVCSDRGSLGEVVADAACLVNPDDPADITRGILRVLEDESYRQTLIDSGLRRSSQFRREDTVTATHSVYRQVGDVPVAVEI